jgi:phage terminase small subunit
MGCTADASRAHELKHERDFKMTQTHKKSPAKAGVKKKTSKHGTATKQAKKANDKPFYPLQPLKNPKRERYCQEYVIDLNATQAAIRAGYSENTARQQGQRLLTNGDIQLRIAYLISQRNERTEIDQDWVIYRLKEVVERCMQVIPVLDREGNSTGEYRFDSSGANKALDCLAKFTGVYEKDNRQKGQVLSEPVTINVMSPADKKRRDRERA